MEQDFINKDFELTHRLIGMLKNIASKTQLNESWVFAALIKSGLKRAESRNNGSDCIFCIVSGREIKNSLALYTACISQELSDKIKLVARMCSLNKYDGELDVDEAVARLLILALTDRQCEFKDALDVDDIDRLYLSNPELGMK